jgi:CRP-like cAMP-binding protein
MMSGEELHQLLIFQDLSPEQLELLRPMFGWIECEEDGSLFEQGDPAEYLYLLAEGEVVVRFKPDDGPALVVARIRPQGVVGWSAALGSPAYTSGAICCLHSRLLRVRGQDLRYLCEHYPETGAMVLERLSFVIAERLRSTHGHVIALLEQGLHLSTRKTLPAQTV